MAYISSGSTPAAPAIASSIAASRGKCWRVVARNSAPCAITEALSRPTAASKRSR